MSKYIIEKQEIIRKEINILPCPFCGSENVKPIHCNGSHGYSASEDYVKCFSCSATGGLITNNDGLHFTEKAIKKWNRRA